jgi:hypothetical protein
MDALELTSHEPARCPHHDDPGDGAENLHACGLGRRPQSDVRPSAPCCIVASADRISRSGRDPVYGKGRINVLAGANCRREHEAADIGQLGLPLRSPA